MNGERGFEIVVVAMVFDGFEVAFAQAKGAYIAFDNIGVSNTVPFKSLRCGRG